MQQPEQPEDKQTVKEDKPKGCVCCNGRQCEHYNCGCMCHSLVPYGYLSYL